MNIAIVGNGLSVLEVNWEKELADKDMVVRIKLGTVKPFFNYVNNNEYAVVNAFCLEEQIPYLQKIDMLKRYKKIFIISYDSTVNSDIQSFIKNNISSPCERCKLKLYLNKLEIINYFNFFSKNIKVVSGFNKNFEMHLSRRNKKTNADINIMDIRYPNILNSFLKKENIKFPSTGLFVILFFMYLYPNAKIKIYGFDSNSGWYWDRYHKADSIFCDWEAEKKFLQKLNLK